MPSRREVRKRLPEAYALAVRLIEVGRRSLPAGDVLYLEALDQVVESLKSLAYEAEVQRSYGEVEERLARSRGGNDRP